MNIRLPRPSPSRGTDPRQEYPGLIPLARRDYVAAAGLAGGILLLYSLTRLHVHNQCVDCTSYAGTIQRADPQHLVQGAHLIYLWLVSSILVAFRQAAPDLTPFVAAQVFNSIAASLAIAVFYLLARRIRMGRLLAVSLSLVLAFSYTFWSLSNDVEVHAPAVFFLLLSLLIVTLPWARASSWRSVLFGAVSALAILFHAFSSLSVPVITALLLASQEGQANASGVPFAVRAKRAVVYVATATIGVVVPYIAVLTQVLGLHSVQEVTWWVFSFLNDPGLAERAGLPVFATIVLTGTGLVRALLGVISWIAAPGLGDYLRQAFAQRCIVEETYLTRSLSPALATAASSASVMAGGLFAVFCVRGVTGLVAARKRLPRITIALILWLVLYAVLLMIAAPASSEHWAFYWLPPFLLAIGCGLSEAHDLTRRTRSGLNSLMGALVTVLFAANLVNILLQGDPENDLYLHRLSWYQANTSAKDLVISSGGYKWDSYLEYYLSTRIEMLDRRFRTMPVSAFIRLAQDEIRAVRSDGGRVFVMQDVLEPEMCQARYGGWDLAAISMFRQAILPRLECFSSEDVRICEVTS